MFKQITIIAKKTKLITYNIGIHAQLLLEEKKALPNIR